MPYTPSSSYNYSFADPFGGQLGQIASQGFNLAQSLGDRGFGLAERQLGLTEDQQRWLQQYQQEQANRGYGLEQGRFGLEKDRFGLEKAQQEFQNRLLREREAQALAEAQQRAYQTRIANDMALGRSVQEAAGPQMPVAPPATRWDMTSGFYPDQASTAQYLQNLLSKGFGIQSGVYGAAPKSDRGRFAYSPI